jgi:hypothetical protein
MYVQNSIAELKGYNAKCSSRVTRHVFQQYCVEDEMLLASLGGAYWPSRLQTETAAPKMADSTAISSLMEPDSAPDATASSFRCS